RRVLRPFPTRRSSDLEVPLKEVMDSKGKKTVVSIRAGEVYGARAPAPPPDSWASDPKNEVGIWTCDLEAGASFELPPQKAGVNRMVYLFAGAGVQVGEASLSSMQGAELRPGSPVVLAANQGPAEVLVLSGRGIGEPVAKSGPFVMNTQAELREAYQDVRATQFGGWPWPDAGPVHGKERDRFARGPDGKMDRPKKA